MINEDYVAYLQNSIRDQLNSLKLVFKEKDGDFFFGMNSDHNKYMINITCDLRGIRFYCSKIDDIPLQHIQKIALFITLLNYRLKYGDFELNCQTGDLRYKTSISLHHADNTSNLNISNTISDMLLLCINMMERYIPEVNRLLQDDNLTPEKALEDSKL